MKKLFALMLVLTIALMLTVPLLVVAEAPPTAPSALFVVLDMEVPVIDETTPEPAETDPGGFLSWSLLITYAGALGFVMAVTQFTKGISLFDRMPTQVWSWIVAMVGMYPAYYFTGQLTPETAAIVPINAIVVSLGANGGFEFLSRLFKKT